jgi:3-dehydroquinate dehydratase/shikimate dehydrogenase
MICVTLGRTRHKMMIAEHQSLAAKGAPLVELRLDWLRNMPDLKRLIEDRPTPVVVTCRRPPDGGRWRGAEEQRQMLLRQSIVAGVEYVDLEADTAGQIRRYGKTRRIISHHDFRETPDNLEEIHAQLVKLDPDIVKIVTMANTPSDNVRLLKLVAESEVPTIGFCMGDLGLVSRVLCGKYGSPFSYATFNKDREMAPGQLSFEQMRDLYHFDEIDADTQVYGVLGDPIAHSFSPVIHNAAFRHERLNCVYLPLRVPAEEFEATLQAYAALEIRGYSVTIPHKEAAARVAGYPDAAVQAIGAANTLYRDDRGRWYAANTDYDAALAAIRSGMAERGDDRLAGKKVLILGAGGVAKAIALGVSKGGAGVTIANRNKNRGRALAEQLNCQFINWENRGSVFADILVNCTPVGMFPDMDDTPFPEHWLRDGMLVFDTIYNPENTLLLKSARTRGCATVSGMEMFLRQAATQFECFVNRPAPVEVMSAALRHAMSPVRIAPEPPPLSEATGASA